MADESPILSPLADARGELEIRKGSWRKNSWEVGPEGAPVVHYDAATFRGRGRIEAADGTWAVKSRGGLGRKGEITDEATGSEVARYEGKVWLSGGRLEVGEASYELDIKGVLTKTRTWRREGRELVRMTFKGSFNERKGHVEVTEDGRSDPAATLLIGMGVHSELQRRRAGAVAGGAAAGGAGGAG